jgi:hypothetical protein
MKALTPDPSPGGRGGREILSPGGRGGKRDPLSRRERGKRGSLSRWERGKEGAFFLEGEGEREASQKAWPGDAGPR